MILPGYSFTEDERGFVSTAEQAAEGIYEFLTQFFTMFPHLQKNEFYHAGVSYGGTYAVETSTIVHKRNADNPKVFINLQGIIGDSAWYDSFTQIIYGDILFNAGLVSANARDVYREKEQRIMSLLAQDKYAEGTTVHIAWYIFCDIFKANLSTANNITFRFGLKLHKRTHII